MPDKQDQCTTTTHANRTILTNMSHQKPDSADPRCTYSQMPVKQDQHIRQVPCPAKRGSLPAPGEPSPNHLNWLDPQRTRNPQQNQEPPPGLDPQRTRTPNKTKSHHPNQELYTYGIIHRITGPTLIPTKTGFHNCTEAQCLTNRASAHKPTMRIVLTILY